MINGYNSSSFNNKNYPNESFGIIFRQKNSLRHSKGINKICFVDNNIFLTGGRDSVIKLWNNIDDESLELKANFESHIDWVNDIIYSKANNLLISCSNDKSVKLWKIPNEFDNNGIETLTPGFNINNLHNDYVKSLAFSEKSGNLFSAGLDGKIIMMKLEEDTKSSKEIHISQEYSNFESTNSIYSIDCDLGGDLLLSSVYENTIQGYDTRQKKSILNLRGHKGIVRGVRIHPNGKIAISISSDKTIKIWDLGMHRVLKNWDFHKDSIHSLFVNEYFTKVLTGGKNGEIYFTDLTKNCYSLIDHKKDENIISLTMNEKYDIFVGTDKNKLMNYSLPSPNKSTKKLSKSKENVDNEENKIIKIHVNNASSAFQYFCVEFNNEIIKYHLLKNKIYLLCLFADGNFMIFNILKGFKIFEKKFDDNYFTNFEIMLDNISQYDTITLKSWFTVDIKLGVITITFNRNTCFSNTFNFDQDYLEKILEKTENFNKVINPKNFNFNLFDNETNQSSNNSLVNTSSGVSYNKTQMVSNKNSSLNENPSNSFNKKDIGMNSIKINNLGNSFIKSLFYTFVNDNLLEIKDFISKNFIDKKGYLQKNFYEKLKSTYSFETEMRININQDIYLFSCENDHVKNSAYLKDFKNYIKTIEFIKEFSPVDQLSKLLRPNFKHGEKIEVVISNERKEFKRKRTGESSTNNYVDEIEAANSTSISSLKNWIIKNYICQEYLSRSIIDDYRQNINSEIEDNIHQILVDKSNLHHFIEIQIFDGVFIKNFEITIGHLKQLFNFSNSNLTIFLRFSGINPVLDRRAIKLPKHEGVSTTPKK